MTVAPFRNHLPVKIRFGEGVAADLGSVLADEGASRPLIVIDQGLEGLVAEVAAAIAPLAGAERFEKEPGEPTVDARRGGRGTPARIPAATPSSRSAAARRWTPPRPPGSSPARASGTCASRAARWPTRLPPIPLVCVPTTAGTGSEVSGGAVITDDATHTKAGIASPLLRAQHALVDPVLTWGLPPGITAMTGIDALAQAIAAVVVRAATPVGDGVALEATRLAGGALVRAVRDGSDHGARSDMACASLLAGLAMNISDCGAEHSLGQAIGGMFGLPHGLTIALVLAETMDRDRRFVPERFERIADALEEPQDGSGDGSRAIRAVTRILNELEFDTLEAVGVREEHLDELTEKALADYFISIAPEPWSAVEVREAYAQGLALGGHR